MTARLSRGDIETILGVLDGWIGRLTWGRLVDAVESRLCRRYSRQALSGHARIKRAFSIRKKMLNHGGPKALNPKPLELQKALERIARLEASNQRLEAEKNAMLEQFCRWAYNAHLRGLDEDYLNQPLPRIDREPTRTQ